MATHPEQAEDLLTASIDDYLLALADGIHKAQRQLSQISIALQPGQPAITYQLPRVDFEFKVSFALARAEEATAGAGGGGALRLRPAGGEPGGRNSTAAEAASVIKGSFVAVPALGGKPPAVVTTRLERLAGRRLSITVQVASAAGEKLAGVPVELNVDRELSRRLNRAFHADRELSAETDLWHGRIETDADGIAQTVLKVSPSEPAGSYVAVLIDVLNETRTVTFHVEA
jgi:hypothetical protein